jgi:hypothetical protein
VGAAGLGFIPSGILLGPEKTNTHPGGVGCCFFGQATPDHPYRTQESVGVPGFWGWPGVVWLVVVVGLWVCLLFENCTVDASIFVVKLSRADGGCLGTRSR